MKSEKKGKFNLEEEIILLLRSSKMTVCLEGIDDKKIFNTILRHKNLDSKIICRFFGDGGRSILLAVYDRYKQQIKKATNPILFFADQDTWVFTDIPEKYREVHFTKGYSIENDLFEDGREAILRLLYPAEKERFDALIDNVCEWYAYQVKLIIDGKAKDVKFDIEMTSPRYIAPNSQSMNEIHQIDDAFRAEAFDLITQVKSNYPVYLRGKFIFEILERLALDRGRTKENIQIPNDKILHGFCIAEGMQQETSNSARISTLLQNTLNSTPPNI